MRITTAQQIIDIIKPIPADKFQANKFGWGSIENCETDDENNPVDNGMSCFLGHIHRHFNPNDIYAIGDFCGYGARELTRNFLYKVHKLDKDGSDVNNEATVNGYTESEIKERVMHLLTDMVAAGY